MRSNHYVFATRNAARRWFGNAADAGDENQFDESDVTQAVEDDPEP